MSTVITDNLTGKTSAGDVTITSEGGAATMQLQQGVGKVWSNVDNTGTIGVSDSFNVSSATDEAGGQYKASYTNNMSNTLYAWAGSMYTSGSFIAAVANTGNNSGTAASTSEISMAAEDVDGGFTDYDANTLMIMGDLA